MTGSQLFRIGGLGLFVGAVAFVLHVVLRSVISAGVDPALSAKGGRRVLRRRAARLARGGRAARGTVRRGPGAAALGGVLAARLGALGGGGDPRRRAGRTGEQPGRQPALEPGPG